MWIKSQILLTEIIISGDKRLRTTLGNATKKSTVLSRAILPKKYTKRDRSDGSSQERRTRARSRSRSPDNDRKADRYDKRSRNSRNSSKRGKGIGGKSGGKKSRDSDSKKPTSKSSN